MFRSLPRVQVHCERQNNAITSIVVIVLEDSF